MHLHCLPFMRAFACCSQMSHSLARVQGLETTVEESSASMSQELERAVMRSNCSFKEAAEGRDDTLSPDDASSAVASVRGKSLSGTSYPWKGLQKCSSLSSAPLHASTGSLLAYLTATSCAMV